MNYLVAGCKSWNKEDFADISAGVDGVWRYVSSKEELSQAMLDEFNPRYIFFLHWSHIVPEEITQNYECVCFHMTDLPYGRGGSPLQNLILQGFNSTKLTALRMDSGLDTGDIYYKEELSLEGSAEDIYRRASRLSCDLIARIIRHNPQPVAQEGEVFAFKRRKPHESEIPEDASEQMIYDYIRMLDAEGYPHAFIRWGEYKLEFQKASIKDGIVEAKVTIKKGNE